MALSRLSQCDGNRRKVTVRCVVVSFGALVGFGFLIVWWLPLHCLCSFCLLVGMKFKKRDVGKFVVCFMKICTCSSTSGILAQASHVPRGPSQRPLILQFTN